MALDSVKPLCLENPSTGGSQTRTNITEADPLSDALSAAGLYLNGPTVTAQDKAVCIDRATGSSLRLTDGTAQQTLQNIVGSTRGGSNYHGALSDIVHWLPDGPGDGVATGAYLVTNLSGPLTSSRVWYASNTLQVKLFSITYSYPAGSPLPSQVTYVLFSNNAAVRTVVDAVTYTSAIETGRTRSYT